MFSVFWVVCSCFAVRCFRYTVLFGEPKHNQGRGLVDHKLVEESPHSNFIAGRPKAALLFWFFGDFRCGVLLFMVILDI